MSPLLFLYMEKLSEKIAVWVAPKLEELDCFLVDIKINPAGSKIEVYIDRDTGLQIEMCEQVSRFLELHLDNEPGVPPKYILEVSSPGMDNPFKVERQYLKNNIHAKNCRTNCSRNKSSSRQSTTSICL